MRFRWAAASALVLALGAPALAQSQAAPDASSVLPDPNVPAADAPVGTGVPSWIEQKSTDSQTALAHSPTTTGATSGAQGNSSSSSVEGAGSASSGQTNSGLVSASVSGGTTVAVDGTAWQALNSTQSNSGAQSANVAGSIGCAFGALN